MEFTLLWAALTGVVFAWVGTRLWPKRLPDHPTDRIIGAAAAGILVGRLTAMVVQGINPITNPLDILIVRGGVHTGAATISALLAYLWAAKWEVSSLDATAPAALLSLAGWHAGCIWRGACLGTESDLPWAWAASGSEITRHPVELYAALGLVLGAILVSRLPWRLLVRAGAALSIAAFMRLITEPVRLSITGGPTGWYIAGIIVGIVAGLLGSRVLAAREPPPT